MQNQILRGLRSRKDELASKKPGALTGESPYLKMIWVRMFSWPKFHDHPNQKFIKILTLCHKFNRILENVLSQNNSEIPTFIKSTTKFDKIGHFDYLGNFSHSGKLHIWNEFDCFMKRFHRGKQDEYKPLHENDSYRLPPPPPQPRPIDRYPTAWTCR